MKKRTFPRESDLIAHTGRRLKGRSFSIGVDTLFHLLVISLSVLTTQTLSLRSEGWITGKWIVALQTDWRVNGLGGAAGAKDC